VNSLAVANLGSEEVVPRPGSCGTTVAFVHPKGAFDTLIELVEERAGGPAH
jgi:hypothetical protein